MFRPIAFMLSVIIVTPPAALAQSAQPFGGDTVNLVLPRGDADAGRSAFVTLQCATCHPVKGDLELVRPSSSNPGPELGAPMAAVAVADVANSIVAPSHAISRRIDPVVASRLRGTLSPMADFTSVMTIRQLADLVAYIREEVPTMVPLSLDARLEGDDLRIAGHTGLPDGAVLGYEIRHDRMAIDHETPEWMLFTEGTIVVSGGRFQTVVDASVLDAGQFEVAVAFTTNLPHGAAQPADVLERYGERCETLNGPNVVVLRDSSRAVMATAVVQR